MFKVTCFADLKVREAVINEEHRASKTPCSMLSASFAAFTVPFNAGHSRRSAYAMALPVLRSLHFSYRSHAVVMLNGGSESFNPDWDSTSFSRRIVCFPTSFIRKSSSSEYLSENLFTSSQERQRILYRRFSTRVPKYFSLWE
jgi:hypothetical protein